MSLAANRANEVTVSFADAALVFALPPGATLEDIALRIAEVAHHHCGRPVAVNVKLRH